jgi:hypothetical protein
MVSSDCSSEIGPACHAPSSGDVVVASDAEEAGVVMEVVSAAAGDSDVDEGSSEPQPTSIAEAAAPTIVMVHLTATRGCLRLRVFMEGLL